MMDGVYVMYNDKTKQFMRIGTLSELAIIAETVDIAPPEDIVMVNIEQLDLSLVRQWHKDPSVPIKIINGRPVFADKESEDVIFNFYTGKLQLFQYMTPDINIAAEQLIDHITYNGDIVVINLKFDEPEYEMTINDEDGSWLDLYNVYVTDLKFYQVKY